jgi:hypothetical protein
MPSGPQHANLIDSHSQRKSRRPQPPAVCSCIFDSLRLSDAERRADSGFVKPARNNGKAAGLEKQALRYVPKVNNANHRIGGAFMS